MISLMSKSLSQQLAETASDLLGKITDERLETKPTETEKEFFDVLISLSEISPTYEALADAYVEMYKFIQDEKFSDPEFIEAIKKEFPIN